VGKLVPPLREPLGAILNFSTSRENLGIVLAGTEVIGAGPEIAGMIATEV